MKKILFFISLTSICTHSLIAMKRSTPIDITIPTTSSSSKKTKTSLDDLRSDYQTYLNGSPSKDQVKQLLTHFFNEIIVAIKLLGSQDTKEQGIANLQKLWTILYEEKVRAGTLLNIVQQFIVSLNTFINSDEGKKQFEENIKIILPELIKAKPILDDIFNESEKIIGNINSLITQLNEIIKKLPLLSSSSSSSSSSNNASFISSLPLPSKLLKKKPSEYIQEFTQISGTLNMITNNYLVALLSSKMVSLDTTNNKVCGKILKKLNLYIAKLKSFIAAHQATLQDKSICLKDELTKIDTHTPEQQQTPFVQFLHKIKTFANVISALQAQDVPKLVEQFFNKLPALNQDQLNIAVKMLTMATTVAEKL